MNVSPIRIMGMVHIDIKGKLLNLVEGDLKSHF